LSILSPPVRDGWAASFGVKLSEMFGKSLEVTGKFPIFAVLKYLCGTVDAATEWWHLLYP
jgi:hypothetical protein